MTLRVSALSLSLAAALAATPALALDGPYSGSFQGRSLELENLAGRIEIRVGGPAIQVHITGEPDELEAVDVGAGGSSVRIGSRRHHRRVHGDAEDLALFRITVPAGTDLALERVTGEAEIGDIGGRLKLHAIALDGRIGAVRSADLVLTGSGDLSLGDVAGPLAVAISGSGDFDARSAESAAISIAGSGDVGLGDVRTGLTVKIAGSGDVGVRSVNGPVAADLAGSGDVEIARGRANPLRVNIVGSGDFDFGGEAVDPVISIFGSGSVRIGSYTGRLQSRGSGNLEIGR